jgi:hypothetical protein
MAVGLQGRDQTQFVFGAGAGVNVGVQTTVCSAASSSASSSGPVKHLHAVADADLGGDGARRDAVVAGDHLDPNPGFLGLAHGADGFLARRVADAQQAQQG